MSAEFMADRGDAAMTAYWIAVAFLFGFLARDCWQDWLENRTCRCGGDAVVFGRYCETCAEEVGAR